MAGFARALLRLAQHLGRGLLILVAILALAIGGLGVGLHTRAGESWVTAFLVGWVNRNIGGQLRLGRIHGSFVSGLEIEDLELRDSEGQLVATAAHATLRYALLPLLHHQIRVQSLVLTGGRLRARILDDGRLNLAALGRPEVPDTGSGETTLSLEIAKISAELVARYEPAHDSTLPPFEGSFQVTGALELGANTLSIRVAQLDGVLTVPVALSGSAAGGLHRQGGVLRLDPSVANLELRGEALRGVLATPRLTGAYQLVVHSEGAIDELSLRADLTTPSGPVHARGLVAFGAGPRWSGAIEAHGLDPGHMIALSPHGVVDLVAHGRGEGRHGQIEIERLRVAADGAHADAHGSLRYGSGLTVDAEAQLVAPDLSRLARHGLPEMQGRLEGKAHVVLAGRQLRIDADVDGQALRIASLSARWISLKVHSRELTGEAVLAGGEVQLGRLSLSLLRARLSGTRQAIELALTAHGDARTSIDLALHGRPRYSTAGRGWPESFEGTVTVLSIDRNREHWTLARPAQLRYDDALHLEGLRLVSERGAVELELHAKGPLSRPELSLHLEGTDSHLVDRSLRRFKGTLDGRLGGDRAQARLDLDADGDRIQIDADLPRYEGDLVQLLRSPALARLRVQAQVASLAHLFATLGLARPAPLAAIEGRLALALTLDGSLATPTLALTLGVTALSAGQYEGSRLQISLAYAKNRLDTLLDLALSTDAGKRAAGRVHLAASLPLKPIGWAARSSPFLSRFDRAQAATAQLLLSNIDVVQLPWLELGIAPLLDAGALDARIDLEGSLSAPRMHATANAHDLRRGAIDHVALGLSSVADRAGVSLDAELKLKNAPLALLAARTPERLLTLLSPASWRSAVITASLSFPGFDLSALRDLLPEVGGRLNGKIIGKGTLSAPVIEGAVRIDGLHLGGTRFRRFTLETRFARQRLRAKLDAEGEDGGRLSGDAQLPLGGDPSAPLQAHLQAKAFKLDFASSSNETVLQKLKGQLDAELALSGPRSAPVVTGHLQVRGGAISIARDARELSGIELAMKLAPGRLELERLALTLGQGRLTATGSATLLGLRITRVDLEAQATRLPVSLDPVVAALDARLHLHGEMKDGALSARLQVDEGSARLPKLDNLRNLQSTRPLKDVRFIDARARAEARRKEALDRAASAVAVVIVVPGPFHVRSSELHVELRGELEVRVEHGVPAMKGEIVALGGDLQLLGQRYEIERVRVAFDGGRKINPNLDVKLSRYVTDAQIFVEVHGTAEAPRLTLRSDPPLYDDSQIVAMILAGDSGARQVTDRSMDQKISGAVSRLLVGAIKDQLAPQLPIDIIKVETGDNGSTGMTSTRIEVGKYISDKIYLSYAHKFGEVQVGTRKLSANEGELLYRFRRSYALDITIGDAPAGRIDVFWTGRY